MENRKMILQVDCFLGVYDNLNLSFNIYIKDETSVYTCYLSASGSRNMQILVAKRQDSLTKSLISRFSERCYFKIHKVESNRKI